MASARVQFPVLGPGVTGACESWGNSSPSLNRRPAALERVSQPPGPLPPPPPLPPLRDAPSPRQRRDRFQKRRNLKPNHTLQEVEGLCQQTPETSRRPALKHPSPLQGGGLR
ncbi:hypothetical protein AAFF_G00402690 [Aldrovandia affinis]|uniref:Uncharacterized protein n=1 Tax=Aldrovandia affinis TaxID=143900 RepID=A0AAD7T7E9_9TELE|nr:hypothetical protein AAFF_G00402690 [Aldrovandia affinis]